MLRSLSTLALAGAATGALCLAGAAYAQAERPRVQPLTEDVPDYYDYYAVGYDANYDDDWFFDYYAFDAQSREPHYDYYTEYDYQRGVFDWEERGLFDDVRNQTPGQMQPGREM